MRKDGYVVAVAGATGAVGEVMLRVLEERKFPVRRIRLLASERSVGKTLKFNGEEVKVEQRRASLLSRLRPGEGGPPSRVEPLLKKVRSYNPKADLKELQAAFRFAEISHEGQRRISAPLSTNCTNAVSAR